MPDSRYSPIHGCQLFRILTLLIIDHRLLESLSQIDTVHTQLAHQFIPMQEDLCPVERLLMDQFTQIQQELIPGNVIEPIDYHQVVATTLLTPEGPVS